MITWKTDGTNSSNVSVRTERHVLCFPRIRLQRTENTSSTHVHVSAILRFCIGQLGQAARPRQDTGTNRGHMATHHVPVWYYAICTILYRKNHRLRCPSRSRDPVSRSRLISASSCPSLPDPPCTSQTTPPASSRPPRRGLLRSDLTLEVPVLLRDRAWRGGGRRRCCW